MLNTEGKYTLLEFIAANESKNFNMIDEGMLDFAKQMIEGFHKHAIDPGIHGGDCTKMPAPCLLCSYERILSDYREYLEMTKQEIALNWWKSLSDDEKHKQLDSCQYVSKDIRNTTGLDISYMAVQANIIDTL